MKYGVFSNTVSGLNLFSTHYSKKAAEKVCENRSKNGFPCVVKAVK